MITLFEHRIFQFVEKSDVKMFICNKGNVSRMTYSTKSVKWQTKELIFPCAQNFSTFNSFFNSTFNSFNSEMMQIVASSLIVFIYRYP